MLNKAINAQLTVNGDFEITVDVQSYPVDYTRPQMFTCTKKTVTLPAGMEILIGNKVYSNNANVTLNLADTIGGDFSRMGRDVYIYACQGTNTEPVFKLSLNSTVPDGYNADNSRKIGGFHCLCKDVGTISGHTLSGYMAGEIIPNSLWDLRHRPKCDPSGMVYIDKVDVWMDIYLNSWNGSKLVSVNNGVTADGGSTKVYHGELFVEDLANINKRLPLREEFQIAAKGSNENTNISGRKDWNTTGGHVDTAGRRMISNYGLEDACGYLWQWASDIGVNGSSGWTDSVYGGSDTQKYGRSYGNLYRALLGGYWGDGAGCGSRSVNVSSVSALVSSSAGGRGACEPKIFGND